MNRPYFRNRFLLLIDAAFLSASLVLAYALRYEGWAWLHWQGDPLLVFIAISVPLRVLVFLAGGLYRRLWRHASVAELEQIFVVGLVAAVLSVALGAWGLQALGLSATRIPLSVLFIDGLMSVAVPATTRLLIRIGLLGRLRARRALEDASRVIIVGAGSTGQMIAKELHSNPKLGMTPVGFIDDDPAKLKKVIAGITVLGKLDALPSILTRYKPDRVIIAMPNAAGEMVRAVVKAALDAKVETRTVPGLAELISGLGGVKQLREVEIQDLLRREPIPIDLASVASLANGKLVLVTGAGGSIGSELCRQLAQLGPAHLVLLGHGENSIFEIFNELQDRFPAVPLTPIIADIRDRPRIDAIVRQLRPHAIFHAAAHKHVPLMEENVVEAITNNVAGTQNVIDAAAAAGTTHFVLVSTDKAVRPTSVMGASKRVAEMVVQLAAVRHGRRFVAVRFGNVLGSRGSVVPTFLRQIRSGGPVKVTHPEMRRYFMTIPEAVQLVLQAGALARGSEVFVLDMGQPVKVVDIAADLIRLSGLEVGTDVEIVFTGMRPGEKLYEEMFFSDENAAPTEHPKVLRSKLTGLDADLDQRISALVTAAEHGATADDLRELLRELVPDFDPLSTDELVRIATPGDNATVTPWSAETTALAPKVGASNGYANGNGHANGIEHPRVERTSNGAARRNGSPVSPAPAGEIRKPASTSSLTK